MKKGIIAIIIIGLTLGILLAYSGFFQSVSVSEQQIGPFTLILKEHRGSYHKTGTVFKEMEAALSGTIDMKKTVGIGFYYDDPDKVKEENLRSEIGFIIDKKDGPKAQSIFTDGILRDFPQSRCAVVELPVKNSLTFMMGPIKAYPALGKFMSEKKYGARYGMEIYRMQDKKILYCMPIENQTK